VLAFRTTEILLRIASTRYVFVSPWRACLRKLCPIISVLKIHLLNLTGGFWKGPSNFFVSSGRWDHPSRQDGREHLQRGAEQVMILSRRCPKWMRPWWAQLIEWYLIPWWQSFHKHRVADPTEELVTKVHYFDQLISDSSKLDWQVRLSRHALPFSEESCIEQSLSWMAHSERLITGLLLYEWFQTCRVLKLCVFIILLLRPQAPRHERDLRQVQVELRQRRRRLHQEEGLRVC